MQCVSSDGRNCSYTAQSGVMQTVHLVVTSVFGTELNEQFLKCKHKQAVHIMGEGIKD